MQFLHFVEKGLLVSQPAGPVYRDYPRLGVNEGLTHTPAGSERGKVLTCTSCTARMSTGYAVLKGRNRSSNKITRLLA